MTRDTQHSIHNMILPALLCLCVGLFLFPSASFGEELPVIELSVSFDPGMSRLSGRAVISPAVSGPLTLHVGTLEIQSVHLGTVSLEPVVRDGLLSLHAEPGSKLTIEYQCSMGRQEGCIIDHQGVFLSGRWYPSPEGLALHRLTAVLPEQYHAVSEAEDITIEKTADGNRFSFLLPHPIEKIHLVAGRFSVHRKTVGDIAIYTYLPPGHAGHSDGYFLSIQHYLDLFSGFMGTYPYRRFSVIETPHAHGASFPTFLLSEQKAISPPATPDPLLGHELLHQWLGNLVYVDEAHGDWSEGLTTYLSDHLFEERAGRGWHYRKKILLDYESHVFNGRETPLRDFKKAADAASRAIGYGKSAFVFHMLRRLVGDETFFTSIRSLIRDYRFKKASWDNLKTVFEKASGKDLTPFFAPWLNEKGFPPIEISEVALEPAGYGVTVSFDASQGDKPYIMDMPVSIVTDKGETKDAVPIRGKKQRFSITVDGNPQKMAIDAEYDTFRKLTRDETPPIIEKILAEEKGLLILRPGDDSDPLYSGAIAFFKERGFIAKDPGAVTHEELRGASVIILGHDNPIVRMLYGKPERSREGFVLMTRKNPLNPSKVIVVATASSPEEVQESVQTLPQYGAYSLVAFRSGTAIEKKTDQSSQGWTITLHEPVYGIEVSRRVALNDITERISGRKIVYVGEQHDRYDHHLAQFEVIRGLFKKHQHIAIGMEMFPKQAQGALDDYIAGKTTEKEFLKASRYFKVWGLDYNYYKDIMRFARDNRIPVIALNINREIVSTVSRSGIDALTAEQRKDLPESMDLSDQDYKERLREIFSKHAEIEARSFDNFYLSQVIWDEIMSQSIDDYLKANPDRRMVVIAGGGHIAFGSGIPKRTFRRNGLDYALLLNDESIEKGIADFVLFPSTVSVIPAPKIMAFLAEEGGKVTVASFPDKSISEKAGLKKGDTIISLDNETIESVEDIQIFLFTKKKGDTIRATVLRRRFLLGEREMTFEIPL